MYDVIRKTIGENEYRFYNSSRGNRSGFVHETFLYKNEFLKVETKCQYYNRTWEVYTYQTVMKRAVSILMDDFAERYKEEYKKRMNIKRMTANKKEEFLVELNHDADYMELKELYNML